MGLFMVVACSKENSFKGNEYQLVDAPNGARITLAFDKDENRFMGKIVNNYFGSYEVEGNSISFGNAASTMMMGPQELMEAEHVFLTILPEVYSYKFSADNLVLVTNEGGELVFEKIGVVKDNK